MLFLHWVQGLSFNDYIFPWMQRIKDVSVAYDLALLGLACTKSLCVSVSLKSWHTQIIKNGKIWVLSHLRQYRKVDIRKMNGPSKGIKIDRNGFLWKSLNRYQISSKWLGWFFVVTRKIIMTCLLLFERPSYFCLLNFEQSELHGQNHPHFIDLNELHTPTKFHADRTSLGGPKKVKIISYFPHFEFMDFIENP